MLLCELYRHGLPTAPFERWLFVDTLAVVRTVHSHACLKLQCLSLRIMADTGRAHRALDDCVSLRQVVAAAAMVLGVSFTRYGAGVVSMFTRLGGLGVMVLTPLPDTGVGGGSAILTRGR